MRLGERVDARARLRAAPTCAAVALGLVCWTSACSDQVATQPEPAHALAPPWSSPAALADSESCADCHEEIARSWSETGMARALGPFEPTEFDGLAQVRDDPTGVAYHYERNPAGGVRIVETAPERPDHRIEAELAYAVGAGELDRAFVALRGAFAWFAPLEVVSGAGGRHAALAPGHMALPGQRFTVSITPECLGCHTDRLPPPAFPLNLHHGERWQPRGISCAACHGPAERHAAWRTAELTGEDPAGTDPILRPQELDRVARMSICSACHLEGDVRIAFDSHFGIPRPGRDLLAQRAVFVAAATTQEIGFVSQTERLVLSPCYLESGALDCTSCHDPHRSLRDDEERARVRGACLTCHPAFMEATARASAGACARPEPWLESDGDCASCHMRRTPVYDVAEVEIHDHFIRARPGPPSPPVDPPAVPLRTRESPTGDWVRFTWPGQPPPDSMDDPGLWMMAYNHRGHLDRALARLDLEPGPRAAQLPMYHHTRGSLLERTGRPVEAMQAYERALALQPGFAPAAINLGLLVGLGGERERGIALLDEVLARHPEAVNALRNRAGLRAEGGDHQGFVADLTRAFELHPNVELAEILADYFRGVGDGGRAAEWDRNAAGLVP